jgi:protein involved in polysaccharide export with SLBB domain
VYDQNSFLYGTGKRVSVYLGLAGGPNRDADYKHAFLIRADGEVVSSDLGKGLWAEKFKNLQVYPGDTIVVPEKTYRPGTLRTVLAYSQLFSQLALGAAAISVIAP